MYQISEKFLETWNMVKKKMFIYISFFSPIFALKTKIFQKNVLNLGEKKRSLHTDLFFWYQDSLSWKNLSWDSSAWDSLSSKQFILKPVHPETVYPQRQFILKTVYPQTSLSSETV